jgi:hypothetical protein
MLMRFQFAVVAAGFRLGEAAFKIRQAELVIASRTVRSRAALPSLLQQSRYLLTVESKLQRRAQSAYGLVHCVPVTVAL